MLQFPGDNLTDTNNMHDVSDRRRVHGIIHNLVVPAKLGVHVGEDREDSLICRLTIHGGASGVGLINSNKVTCIPHRNWVKVRDGPIKKVLNMIENSSFLFVVD